VINASGCGKDLLKAHPYRVIVSHVEFDDLDRDSVSGRHGEQLLSFRCGTHRSKHPHPLLG
jgi:hypothetical protein